VDYDRFGHCPGFGNNNGDNGGDRPFHRGHGFGTNDDGGKKGGQNDNDNGKHFRHANTPDRGQSYNRYQDPKGGRQPDNYSGYGH
jgi:hypothetical protein